MQNPILAGVRHLRRHKGFAIIHVVGLSVGIASALAIGWFVHREMTVDRFHMDAERVYRLIYDETIQRPDGGRLLATTSPPMAPTLKGMFSQIEHAVRLRLTERDLIQSGGDLYYEDQVIYADPDFFRIFSFEFAAGDPYRALAEPNTVVLSHATAKKYFGDKSPLGQTLRFNREIELKVTGVLEPSIKPTHLKFDLLVSFSTFKVPSGYPVTLESWQWISFHTYVKLRAGVDASELQAQMTNFVRANHLNGKFDLRLQPISEIYLGPVKHADISSGNPAMIYGLALVGLLILIVAGLNYVNLATARSLNRAREVGIRKIVGATPGHVIRQFVMESVAVAMVSALMSLLLLGLLSEWVAPSMGLDIVVQGHEIVVAVTACLFLGLAMGIAAGSYPALVASRFEAIRVLKGFLVTGKSRTTLRTILVTAQFCITIALLIAILVIHRQLDFVSKRDLGYDKDAIVVLQMIYEGSDEVFPRVRSQLEKNPSVLGITGCSSMMDGDNGNVPVFTEEKTDGTQMDILGVQFDFFKSMKIRLTEGREFDRAFPTDVDRAVVLNRKAVEYLGLRDPIGKKIRIGDIVTDGEVIGIVDDFHHASLREELKPVAFFIADRIENMYVRVNRRDLAASLSSIESDWHTAAPQLPFQFKFLDEHLASMYRLDAQMSSFLLLFGVLTITVACLGLYGLVSFTTIQRSREIGIRKVLGAGVSDVVLLLSKQFMLMVVAAGILVAPLSLWIMNQWLQNFAYRIEAGWEFAGIAVFIAFCCAWIAMGYECLRAALSNPVHVLTYE